MASEYKTCPKCKRTLLRVEGFYWHKNGARGIRWESYCKECHRLRDRSKDRSLPAYELKLAQCREWHARNRERELEKMKARYFERYKSQRIEDEYKLRRHQRKVLADVYIRQLLAQRQANLSARQITPELIELKREHMLVKRAKKQIKAALKEHYEASTNTE